MSIINIKSTIPSIGEVEQTLPVAVSQLGTLLFDNITFPAGKYINDDGVEVEYNEVRLDAVQFRVNQAKNIVKTAIAGRKWTVKEYISEEDYIISLDAKISERYNVYPNDQINDIVALKNVPDNLPVISKVLNNNFNIYEVVIEDIGFSPGSGTQQVEFSMTLSSDQDFDLKEFNITRNE